MRHEFNQIDSAGCIPQANFRFGNVMTALQHAQGNALNMHFNSSKAGVNHPYGGSCYRSRFQGTSYRVAT